MADQTCKNVRKIREDLLEAKAIMGNTNPEIPAIICGLMAYLKEEVDSLYLLVQVIINELFSILYCIIFDRNRNE